MLALILVPLLWLLVQRMERDRNARLLEETGATVSVGLNGKRIVGVEFHDTTIDSATAQLLLQHPAIHRLAFTDCRIEAGIPEMLTRLPQLATLELKRLEVAVPGELAQLFKTVPLSAITLNECPADTLPAEINSERLRTIRIEQFRGEPEGLIRRTARLPGLRSLRYSGTPLPLALCQSVCRDHPELDFEVNSQDIAELKPLRDSRIYVTLDDRFEVVGLYVNRRSAPIPNDAVAQLSTLRQVTLVAIDVDADMLETLLGLENLQSLNMAGSKLTDGELKQLATLPRLRHLNLNGVTTTTREAIRLPSLPRLRALHASSPAITNESVAGSEFPSLEELSTGPWIPTHEVRRLLTSGTVRNLSMFNQHLDNDLLNALAASGHLQSLLLWNCTVDQEPLGEILFPDSLETLRLAGTDVSPAALEALRSSRPQLQIVVY
ncbi:hypothetical protein [Maioricimonas sp. JC845]|uniref:hypothetical protein n=1 Tax=Maioricimonas sp. JC845 TaxID=3232138 RepID=UPI003458405F